MNSSRPQSRPRPFVFSSLFALSAVGIFAVSGCELFDKGGDEIPSQPDDKGGIDSAGDSEGSQDQDSEGSGEQNTGYPEDGPDFTSLRRLEVLPLNTVVELDLKKSETIDFKAIAYYDDGRKEDVTDKVEWVSEDQEVAKFEDDQLKVAAHDKLFVDTTRVQAKFEGALGIAQVTVAAYRRSGESTDFLFILPHQDKKGDKSSSLGFATDVPSLDVFFNVDTTKSMAEEIDQLQMSLSNEIIPGAQKEIENTHFGVGSFEDFPVIPYGSTGMPNPVTNEKRPIDQPFRLLQPVTDKVDAVQKGVNALKVSSGGDLPESALESLYQIATGEGLSEPSPTDVPKNQNGVGGVEFRKGTMPVVVTITDAASHAPGETDDGCGRDYNHSSLKGVVHSRKQTEDALEKICARVIYVASEGGTTDKCDPVIDGQMLATATKSRVHPSAWDQNRPQNCAEDQCCTGKNGEGVAPDGDDGLCSLVYRVDKDGNGLGKTIVSGLKSLAFFAPFDVAVEPKGESKSTEGVALPQGKTTLDFISKIEAESFGKLPLPGLPEPKIVEDHFENVTPGTEVKFKIRAFNDFVTEKPEPQVFRAKIGVKADQCEGLQLDEREVIFIVPPKPIVVG